MNETVKIDLKISRNDVSLVNVIEPGLTVMGADDKSSNLFDVILKENITGNICIC